MTYVGGFFNLIKPYALLGGLVSLLGFTLQGSIFLSLKTEGELCETSQKVARRLWLPTFISQVAYVIATYFFTDVISHLGINPGPVPIFAVLVLMAVGYFVYYKRSGWAFALHSLSILLSVTTIFLILFPRVMVSSLDPAWSLTIYNAASGPNTLRVMSIVTLIILPFVLGYQIWSYWVFRKRVGEKVEDLHY
jgi:cytochrome d ubiquinol oxidase subunit II